MKDLGGVWGGFGQGFGKVLGRFWEGLGAFWALWGPAKVFVAVLVHFWVVWVFFNVLGQFLVIFVVCGYFGLLWDVFVECGLLGSVFLRIVVCGPVGRHRDLSACFGSFLLCFFHFVAPRGASAASVARHQRGKSRKEERQDEEEAFLKFAWLFLLLLAIPAFYCFFFA